MIDINTVILENGLEYNEIDDLVYNDIKYVLLSNINDVKDSCIRKIIINDDEKYISRLEDDNEFDMILGLFIKKNATLFS